MIYRRFEVDDRDRVIALLESVFGGWGGADSSAYWSWKFDRNPHGSARIWVAEEDDVIAGCYVYNPVRVVGCGKALSAAQSVDAAVDVAFQGRGVFTELAKLARTEAVVEGFERVYAFPTEGAYKGQVRIGFVPQEPIAKLYRPLLYAPRASSASTGLSFRMVAEFDARFATLAERPDDGFMRVHRDPGYLTWRYLEHPDSSYEILACEREGDLCGYSVLIVDTSRRLALGYLIDFQVAPELPAAAEALLTQSLRRLRASGARCAVTWDRPASAEWNALKGHGFSDLYDVVRNRLGKSEHRERFIVLDLRATPTHDGGHSAASSRGARWSLVPGDADYT